MQRRGHFGQDSLGRQNRSVSPGGTITRTVFDVRGQAIKIYVGTNDTGATESDPTGGGASGNNMVLVTAFEYDGGAAAGDGLRTKETQHVDASETRVTLFLFDWRGRETDIDGEIDFYQKTYFDNLDRVIRVERYNTYYSGESSSSSSSGTSGLGNLIARSDTKYDDHGRVYQSKRYAVNVGTGIAGAALTDNTWYDAAGNVLKQKPAGGQRFTKTKYDSLGRPIKTYIGFDVDESAYAEALDVLGDSIFEQTESGYDDASNVILSTLRRRLHDATGTGELSSTTGSQPRARVSYLAYYHDAVGRQVAQANYGTNGDVALTRPSTVPARSDDVLVSSTGYNSDGEAFQIIDPAGKEDRVEFDDAGRVVKRIENYVVNSSSSSSSSSSCGGPYDQNVTVRTAYGADGLPSSITAENCVTGDQVTRYVYGTTLSNSDVARSDLLRSEIYPDSDDVANPLGNGPDNVYDRIEYKYNRQGQRTEMKDQNETVHAYDFDKLGRLTQDRVTTLGSGVNGAVLRIATTFEVRGLREKVTSYDNAAVGSGSVVNDVVSEYNDLAMLVKEYQEHDGAKDASTPYIGYNFDETIVSCEYTKGLRATSLRYPNGRLVHYTYGSSGSDGDSLSRQDAIKDDNSGTPGAVLASYKYLGLGNVVIQDCEEPQIKLDRFGGSSGTYAGFDRFDRVVDHRWHNYGSSTDVDRIQYGYDRNGNRLWRANVVATSQDKNFDGLYVYDGVDRLLHTQRGRLNAQKNDLAIKTLVQDWSLDQTGNWSVFRQDDDGNSLWDLNQQRASNAVNEIIGISESTGSSWANPVYDATGNMTTAPKPTDPTTSFTVTYDSWYRLVEVTDASTMQVITQNVYDGRGYCINRKNFVGGSLAESRNSFFTQDWRCLENRVNGSADAHRQFVWGIRYVDDLILRDHDTDSDGNLDERLYGLQDANWNLSTVADSSGSVQERFEYGAYGEAMVLTPSFATRLVSDFDWEFRFGGYLWDSATQFYLVRNRALLPLIGWVQRDPIRYADGMNLYEYVSSSPIKFTDPYGDIALDWECALTQLVRCRKLHSLFDGGLAFCSLYWTLLHGIFGPLMPIFEDFMDKCVAFLPPVTTLGCQPGKSSRVLTCATTLTLAKCLKK